MAYSKRRMAERERLGIKVPDSVLEKTFNKISKAGYKVAWSKKKGNWVKGTKKQG